MSFTNYLEDENDKPYFTKNSLAYYYDKMEGFSEKVEQAAKILNVTKEEVEKNITSYIEQNKSVLDLRLKQWDEKLGKFDSSVETLLTEWVDDGTLTHVIDSTLIDQKIAPVTLQLADTVKKEEPGVISWAMASQGFRENITGGTTAIVGVESVIPVSLTQNAVNFEHVEFVEESSNLFNLNNIMPGFTVSGSTGQPVANTGFNLSEVKRIEAEQQYSLKDVGRWAWFDYSMTFIASGTTENPITPANAFFGIFAVSNGSLRTAQVNKGSVVLPYDEHWKRFKKNEKTGFEVIPTAYSIGRKAVNSNTLSPDLTTYWKTPKNLFNKQNLLNGKVLDYGKVVDSAEHSTTADYLRLKPETAYSNTETITIDFHDKQDVFITRRQATPGTFTTPKNVYIGRISVLTSRVGSLMFSEGSSTLPYEDHVYELQSTPQYPIKIPAGESSGENGGGSTAAPSFDEPFLYSVSESIAAASQVTVCSVLENCFVQEIEVATNGAKSELIVNIRNADGTLSPFLLLANDGSGYVPITPENLIAHGTVDFLFSAYDTVEHQYKFTMKGKQFANGLVVNVRNNDTTAKNITCRVVGGTYV